MEINLDNFCYELGNIDPELAIDFEEKLPDPYDFQCGKLDEKRK